MSDEISEEDLIVEEDLPDEDEDEIIEEIVVNFWRTGWHDAAFGIRQLDQYRARSRQWSAGMQVRGDVTFKDKKDKKYIIGFNEEAWSENEDGKLSKKHGKFTHLNSRIIIKLFNELKDNKGGNWKGSLELSILESLVLTIGERVGPLPVFYIILPRYPYVIRLIRSHTRMGQRYIFPIIDKENKEPTRIFEIEKKMISAGLDFKVEDSYTEKEVANVDGKLLDLGGKWVIHIKDKTLKNNRIFRMVVMLFACLCKYIEEINDNIKNLHEQVTKKKYKFQPDHHERSMFYNPRVGRR
ncbi:MAG: hypothetical protein ACTSRG_01330 [Candidatus Helarchaeota archaeon]